MQRNKKQPEAEKQPMMTVAELSTYLSLSARSVHRLIGDLPAIRVGGRWRFRVSDVEEWLLKQRKANEPPVEPVVGIGSKLRLFSHMDEANIFLDVAQTEAAALIREAIDRATLKLTGSSESESKERIALSFIERENLCSTALHPDVAFPHPRDPEQCPFGADQIVIVRAAQPVEFREIHGYRPRVAFLLLARTASLQLLWQARLSYLLHHEGFVPKLLEARSPRELYAVFSPEAQASGDPQERALMTT